MANSISRRSFVASTCTGILSLALAREVSAAGYRFRFESDDEFTGDWVEWLAKVVGYASRMIEPRVVNNFVKLNAGSVNLADGVWDRSQYAKGRLDYWRQKENMLEHQLRCLQMHEFDLGFRIRWKHDSESPYWAWGPYSTVTINYDPESDGVVAAGGFDVWLNAYWATTTDARNRPEVWGGVIAHEMLHNLGHAHGKDEYDDRWQINVFDRCVTYDGKYAGGYRQHKWLCGGRTPT